MDPASFSAFKFQLSKKERVIGKINENIFYILAVDPKFDLYQHGWSFKPAFSWLFAYVKSLIAIQKNLASLLDLPLCPLKDYL